MGGLWEAPKAGEPRIPPPLLAVCFLRLRLEVVGGLDKGGVLVRTEEPAILHGISKLHRVPEQLCSIMLHLCPVSPAQENSTSVRVGRLSTGWSGGSLLSQGGSKRV